MSRLPWLALLFIVFLAALDPKPAKAEVAACEASISPASVNTNTTSDFTINLDNVSGDIITWIKITRPSTNYQINAISASGWSGNATDTSGTLTGSELGASDTLSVTVNDTSGSSTAGAETWVVQVSDDADGASPTTCTGSLNTSITSNAPTPTPATVTVTVGDTTTPTLNITFDTAKIYASAPLITGSASDNTEVKSVDYSTNDGATWTAVDKITSAGSKTTDFSFTPKLLPSGVYKVKARAKDAAGNIGTTSAVTLTIDRSNPKVTLTTDLSKPFATSPTIIGTAADTSGITTVAYSLDSGASWLPVDEISSGTFSFTPALTGDGNYPLQIRAEDAAGNTNDLASNSYQLVIDRLPPKPGLPVFSIGPLVLSPDSSGNMTALPNMNIKVTLSQAGGPIQSEIKIGEKSFPLTKNPSTGLWSTTFSFDSPGEFSPEISSLDGAGNSTSKSLAPFAIISPGRVTGPQKSTLTIYVKQPSTARFIPWSATPYDQVNPQQLSSDLYSLLLPPGTYYLKAKSDGYVSQKTTIFTLTETTPIPPAFDLKTAKMLNLIFFKFPLPFQSSPLVTVTPTIETDQPSPNSKLIGTELPSFELTSSDVIYTNLSLRGKPTLLVFLNTWTPNTASQLARLNQAIVDQQLQVLVIFPHESAESIAVFKSRGGYKLNLVADPDGVLIEALSLTHSPTYIQINRRGLIEALQSPL